jgi:hypothetical protein
MNWAGVSFLPLPRDGGVGEGGTGDGGGGDVVGRLPYPLGASARQPAADQFESSLPTPLELAGDKPVVRIDTVELTLGEGGLIAEPLNLLLGVPQGFIGSPLSLAST